MFKSEVGDVPLYRFAESVEEAPEFEKVLYTNKIDGIVSHFGRYRNGYRFVMIPPEGARLELWLDQSKRAACFKGSFDFRLLRFACWMAYGMATVPFQTVAIHTSTIVCKGKGVLFLGESGKERVRISASGVNTSEEPHC